MKFKDFQAPVLFSNTFKALNLGENNSSTFKDFQGCVGTLLFGAEILKTDALPVANQPVLKTSTGTHPFFRLKEERDVAPFYACPQTSVPTIMVRTILTNQ